MAIEVSLWGPGSLLTSTLGPTETLCVAPGPGSGVNPGAETVSNFCHQVGWLYVEEPELVAAEAGRAQPSASARTKAKVAAAIRREDQFILPPAAEPHSC